MSVRLESPRSPDACLSGVSLPRLFPRPPTSHDLLLNERIDDHSRLLDGGEVLRLDVYEASEMVGGLRDVGLDVSRTAVVSWTVLICWELDILEANGELCKMNLDAPFRMFE